MTGFGEIQPLPGVWNSLHLDTAVTLPVGVEAYAAFALHAWLTSNPAITDRTRRFARWSAIAAMILGMSGQVAYHLLTQAGATKAPWEVTTLVSCLPVVVLGMGSALAHLLRSDAAIRRAAAIDRSVDAEPWKHNGPEQFSPELKSQDQWRTDFSVDAAFSARSADLAQLSTYGDIVREFAVGRLRSHSAHDGSVRPPARVRVSDAQEAAAQLVASGQAISRRSLRSAGMHGSNADLGMLAQMLRTAHRA